MPKDKAIETLAQINFQLSESSTMDNTKVLKDLFIGGKQEFVMKVFIQLNSAIERFVQDKQLLILNSSSIRKSDGNTKQNAK
jgi:hypothetical protein